MHKWLTGKIWDIFFPEKNKRGKGFFFFPWSTQLLDVCGYKALSMQTKHLSFRLACAQLDLEGLNLWWAGFRASALYILETFPLLNENMYGAGWCRDKVALVQSTFIRNSITLCRAATADLFREVNCKRTNFPTGAEEIITYRFKTDKHRYILHAFQTLVVNFQLFLIR